MLCVNGVSVKYGDNEALKPTNFEAKSGEILGLIGADGAGKSSLLNAVAGVQEFSGEITLYAHRYKTTKESEPIKNKIALMPQGLGISLYKTLSIKEHIDFHCSIKEIKRDAEFEGYLKRLLLMAGLERFLDRKAGDLSGGMMQKLSLVCTLLAKPSLLLLDEPTTGVDPVSRKELWEIIRGLVRSEGIICVASTAYMGEASTFDRLLLFDKGEIISTGDFDSLVGSVADFTYADDGILRDGSIAINGFLYALGSLELPKKEPNLESVFFVRSLKEGRTIPKIHFSNDGENGDFSSKTVLKALSLTKKFGQFVANDSVSLDLNSGEILGLIGANGAGKTTFIKMLLGLLPTDGGELWMLGKNIKSANDRTILKGHIGYVSQRFALYKNLTVFENLEYFAKMHGMKKEEYSYALDELVRVLELKPILHRFLGELVMGMNQRVSLACALIHSPKVLFLDEPTSGVDVIARAIFWEILKELKIKKNISILITTHYMSEADFCDRVAILQDGKKVADDTLQNLYAAHSGAKNFEDIFFEIFGKNESAVKA